MRVANWRAKEVFGELIDLALAEANAVMDDVVTASKAKCPVGTITREGKWATNQVVSFTPRKGPHKNKPVSFVSKRWLGRNPGDLRNTIRRVTKHDRLGNIRVYAGNTKIYWAFMVERGTSKTRAQPFLRPAFDNIKGNIVPRIEKRMRKSPEVKR